MGQLNRGELLYQNPELITLKRQWNLADRALSVILPATILTAIGTIAINTPRISSLIGIEIPQLPPEAVNIACFTPIVPVLLGLASNRLIKYGYSRGKKINDRDIVNTKAFLRELRKSPNANLN